MASLGDRFKTGQICVASGRYQFDGYLDGYLDGTLSPAPTEQERNIPLSKGETFPLIKSTNKACWWKLLQLI